MTNRLTGVRADQQLAGSGSLSLSKVTLTGNANGAQTGDNVTTVTP